jgi:ribose transport system substrate-binding protein
MLLALRSAYRVSKVKFVGFDSSPKLVEAMRQGELHGLVLQDPLRMGYLAVKTMVAHLRGESVRQRIDTGVHMATPENMDTQAMRDLLSPPFQKYLN